MEKWGKCVAKLPFRENKSNQIPSRLKLNLRCFGGENSTDSNIEWNYVAFLLLLLGSDM